MPRGNDSLTPAVSRATSDSPIVVIGAGPAGLTCAIELARQGVPTLVVDADCRVGGIAQTSEYKGFRFDIGGHRFFTKVPAVAEMWRSILGADFIKRPRLSRIYYDKKFFDYPLKPMNALAMFVLLMRAHPHRRRVEYNNRMIACCGAGVRAWGNIDAVGETPATARTRSPGAAGSASRRHCS